MTIPIILDFTDIPAVENLFNEAFQHPAEEYIIQPTELAPAQQWLKDYTWMRSFTWTGEAGPLHYEQLIHLDELYDRGRCGWNGGDYHCNFPDTHHALVCDHQECEECGTPGNDDQGNRRQKRRCFSFNCPIAYEADREDIRRVDPDLYQSDFKPYPSAEPEEWMILHSRPRYAFVPNVRILECV